MIVPVILSNDKGYSINYEDLYVPDDPNHTGRYVLPPGSTVWVNNEPNKVVSVDAQNKTTLEAGYMKVDDGEDGFSSIISHGNDIIRLYVDNRSLPYRVQIDSAATLIGGSPAYYTLTRYPKDPSKAKLISRYYDSTGKYIKDQVPIHALDDKNTEWVCDSCAIDEDLVDDELIALTAYNEIGAEIHYSILFVKHSSIINDQLDYRPRVSALTIKSPQQLSDGTMFLYEKQDFQSLNVYGVLTYEDGTTRNITVDNIQTYLYGVEDLVAAYGGMKQNVTMKYFYGPSETSTSTDPSNQSITAQGSVLILANKSANPVKLSIIPVFNQALQRYDLRYYLYTTARSRVVDCTSFAMVQNNTFDGTNYVDTQQFDVSVDMTKVDSSIYQGTAVYTQGVCIKLLPPTSYIRWTISDSISSPYLYGADNSTDRRPVLYYDKSKTTYFIPSSIFTSVAGIIQSFYKDANPPYDTRIETSAPTPTHYGVRDPFSGMLLSTVALSDYTQGFTISSGNDYTDQTVILEFYSRNSDKDLILFGVPVDVRAGSFVG